MGPCLSKADYTPYHWRILAPNSRTISWTFVVVGGAIGLYTAFIARTVFTYQGHLVGTLFDDALISLRYAHNLTSGHGLVWNPGESTPVEGYSNLAWTLVMSGVLLVFSKELAPIVVSAIAAATLLGCGLAVRRILRTLGSPMPIQVAGVAIVLTYYPLVFWTLRGMEVGFLAWLVLWGVEIALRTPAEPQRGGRDLVTLSAVAGVGFLARNDSILIFAIVLAWAVWERSGWRHLPAAVAPLAVCVAAQFAFRYEYYGELMPNTYVLKMTGAELSERLSRGLDAFAETLPPLVWLGSIAGGALLTVAVSERVRRLLLVGLLLVAVQSAYLVWVGGDAWVFDHSNRFTATVLPVLLAGVVAAAPEIARFFDCPPAALLFIGLNVAFVESLLLLPALDPPSTRAMLAGWAVAVSIAVFGWIAGRAFPPRRCHFLAAGALVATLLIPSSYSWWEWGRRNGHYVPNDRDVAQLGLVWRDQLPPETVIAAGWIGAPAYYSGLTAIDLFGKTDKHIARVVPRLPFRPGHNKEDLAYSVGQLRPDLVLIGLDRPEVEAYGYARVREGLYVRRDSRTLDAGNPAFAPTRPFRRP